MFHLCPTKPSPVWDRVTQEIIELRLSHSSMTHEVLSSNFPNHNSGLKDFHIMYLTFSNQVAKSLSQGVRSLMSLKDSENLFFMIVGERGVFICSFITQETMKCELWSVQTIFVCHCEMVLCFNTSF